MESVWILPLYIICPLIGLLFIGSSLYEYIRYKEKVITRIALGLVLLSLPILHNLILENTQKKYEEFALGKYTMENIPEQILEIKKDGSFCLQTNNHFNKSGCGKWIVSRIDFWELNLCFNSLYEADYRFEIESSNGFITLIPSANSAVKLKLNKIISK